ncbi:CRP/FNR family transcriptional regulator, anaerobic regulatory protein [Evansella caseinilytica]|uniref:CRP/FNR family transcriptional regulator, anaerobic regulatory protein n=1 Tax=Evansella caseinilytica TaxID=1503961 RepID=A0A1H3PP70_9BACI|nr:Crp/Fnr family transcriptional regulator [Evansella caseinilytica]SDZ02838.1 CRP/FNR family transcriptional regulator, anaerobic regulatory protein [Evansella caseinilytica]
MRKTENGFFQQLSKKMQTELMNLGTIETLKQKKILFQEGKSGKDIYILLTGEVRLLQTHPLNTKKRFFLEHYYPYDLVGYDILFQSNVHKGTVEATIITQVLQIQKSDFERMLLSNPEMRTVFLSWIARRVNQYPFMLRDLLPSNIKECLFSVFIRFCHTKGVKTAKGITIQQKLSNVDLADYVGATRESLNRLLHELEESGIISVDKKMITIRDFEFLQNEVHCFNCTNKHCSL